MKKVLFALMVTLATSFVFSSCKSDDDEEDAKYSFSATTDLGDESFTFTPATSTVVWIVNMPDVAKYNYSGTFSVAGDQVTCNINKCTVDGVDIPTDPNSFTLTADKNIDEKGWDKVKTLTLLEDVYKK